jgi:peptidoglycan/LPS O-acetylase OafA/YrhL
MLNQQLSSSTDREPRSLTSDESEALLGLRGLVAFHIMIFHSFRYSKLRWDLVGSSQMPLFFLLSGFFVAYTSGKVKYAGTPCCSEICDAPEDADPQRMDAKHFYRRRIARTLPLYYVCNVASIPLIGSGHGWVTPELAAIALTLMVTCTSSWLLMPIVLDGPSWFVSTLWFYYWCFPSLLPKLQAYSVEQKLAGIRNHFLIQMIVGWILLIGLFQIIGF